MESVGSPQRAAQVSKTALQNSGPEAASKTPEARRAAKAAPSKDLATPPQDLAAAAPQDGKAGGVGGVSLPTPGHGLGQHVDIKV